MIPEPFHVGIEDADKPVPGPSEVLVRSIATGISAGTEMGLYCGKNPDLVRRRWGEKWVYPMYPGYESVGIVSECGPGVSESLLGQRVVSHGGHAQFSAVSTSHMVKLPEQVADEAATLAVLATTALHGVRRATIEYGDTVAVVGMGLMGQFAIQHARLAGAIRTIAVDPDPWRLEVAARVGADHTIDPGAEDPQEAILGYTETGADAVIETAGVSSAVPLALRLARDRGRVSIVGWHLEPVELVLAEDFLYKELDIRASRGSGSPGVSTPEHMIWTAFRNRTLVVNLLAEGRLRTDGLITHVLPFEEISRAYEMIQTKSEPSLQVVLSWDGATRNE